MAHAHASSPRRPLPQHIRVVHSAGGRAVKPRPSAVPNVVVGVLVFLAAEAMLFAGLLSALLILRANSTAWPPPDQPRLPIAATAVNTLILLASGFTMRRALGAARKDESRKLSRCLFATALLGTIFLAVQGAEWVRLIAYGLHVSSGVYGSTFYTLIGCHGLHVFVGIIILFVVLWQALKGRYSARNDGAVEACRLYWTFVVGVWPVLYVLVYLI